MCIYIYIDIEVVVVGGRLDQKMPGQIFICPSPALAACIPIFTNVITGLEIGTGFEGLEVN